LAQETWQRCRIADVIGGEVRADDRATNKVKTEVALVPRAPFALGFMFFLKLFDFAEDRQADTIHCQMNRIRSGRFARHVQSQALAPAR
jgi:hypothetical protein